MKRPYSALLLDQQTEIVDLLTISAFSGIRYDLNLVPELFEALLLDHQSLPALHAKFVPFFEDDKLTVPSFAKTFDIWRQVWLDDREHLFTLLSLLIKKSFGNDPDVHLIMTHLSFQGFNTEALNSLQSFDIGRFEITCKGLLSCSLCTGRTLENFLSMMPMKGCIRRPYLSRLHSHPVMNSLHAVKAIFQNLAFEFGDCDLRLALHGRCPEVFAMEALEHCKPGSITFGISILKCHPTSVAIAILNAATFNGANTFLFKIALSQPRIYGPDFIKAMCSKMPVVWGDELRDYAKKYGHDQALIDEFAQLSATIK